MDKIIQITSGKGPLECQWVVAKVLKVFLEEAKQNKIDYEIIHRENDDENLTLKSATLLLKGKEANEFLKNWLGSILWIGKSTFRKFHKRSNWFIGIFELEGLEKINFNEKDIQFQTTRSQGSGGQNVNKVETSVTVMWKVEDSEFFNDFQKNLIFTKLKNRINLDGILQLTVSESRTQLQNKKIATEKILEIVNDSIIVPKTRFKTKPSKAKVQKRLDSKKKLSDKKENRRFKL